MGPARPPARFVSGAAALVWGVPHGVYHVLNTDGLAAGDVGVSLLGLAVFAVVGGGLLWSAGTLGRPAPERIDVQEVAR